MPERPLLILPTPGQPVVRRTKPSGRGSFGRPTHDRQVQRLAPRFTALTNAFETRTATLRIEATGIVPEQALVLETFGAVDDFIVAVRNTPGLEWLGEVEEEDIPPDDDFFALDSSGHRIEGKVLRGRIFLVFSNQQALTQLLSLWQRWQMGQPFARGLSKWKDVFAQLRDIRPWGVEDRLRETGVLDDWRDRIGHNQDHVPCEIELWFRQSIEKRTDAQNRVTQLVSAQGGRIINHTTVTDINYHALLVELPVGAVGQILRGAYQDVSLVQCEQIQFFRATGQMGAVVPEGNRITDVPFHPISPMPTGEPIVALFDGFPLQNHSRLAGRLIVDDPDGIEASYQTQERRHGTGMASLILHGELDENEAVLTRPLYVRPILRPDPRDWLSPRPESASENSLVVDLVHRAVRRLYDGEGSEPPVAPSVCIANFSIGIHDRLFDRSLSPLAKLLDWLSWRYRILFLVSAGNHPHEIDLRVPKNRLPFMSGADIQSSVLKSIGADARHRRLLSPAEAVNVLTIGALHEDGSKSVPVSHAIDPFVDKQLPSPINAQGMGYRRAIKPEVLLPGGRVVLQEKIGTQPNVEFDVYMGTLAPGQRVAAPGTTAGDLSASWYVRGTSNATALASRAAAVLYDVIQELRNEPGGEIIGSVPAAVWLKTLLVHAAEWGSAAPVLDKALKTAENSRKFREYVTRLLGYGSLDVSRVVECAQQRVTALGGGVLGVDESHIHRFPLPPSLSGQQCWRRLAITLTWLTPINPAHQAWRRADLYFTPPTSELQVDRKQADGRAVYRGTVQHEILEGNRASAFIDGDVLKIQVSCRAEGGTLEDRIPYALAITLEVAEDIAIPIYDEVRVRIYAARIGITTTG